MDCNTLEHYPSTWVDDLNNNTFLLVEDLFSKPCKNGDCHHTKDEETEEKMDSFIGWPDRLSWTRKQKKQEPKQQLQKNNKI